MRVRKLHAFAAAAARYFIRIFEIEACVELVFGQHQFGADEREQQDFREVDFDAVAFGDVEIRRDISRGYWFEFVFAAGTAFLVHAHAHASEAFQLWGQEV